MSKAAHITREDIAEIHENIAFLKGDEDDFDGMRDHMEKADLYRDIDMLSNPIGERTR